MQRREELVESLAGEGPVFKDDRQLAVVRYRLMVTREMLSAQGGNEVDGRRTLTGSIDIRSGDIPMNEDQGLTLR